MKKLLSGNQAIARGAFEAGCVFAAAYPGTPSTEILETISQYDEIFSEWAPNEKVALEVATGAAFAGGRALAAMKHVGLNVASDPLFTLSYTGIKGGIVIVTADDPGMHSSQNEQDNRHYAAAAKIPMLEPADSQEAKDFTIKAFEISEKYDTPVLLRITTRVAHSETLVEINDRVEIQRDYKLDRNPQKYAMLPAHARARHVFVEERTDKLRALAEDGEFNRVEKGKDKTGVITSGIAYQYVRDVMPDAGVLKIGLSWPLPEKLIRDFAAGVDKLYVVEELEPIIETHVRALGIDVIGKPAGMICGELSPARVRLFIEGTPIPQPSEKSRARPPVMCAGCPHRGIFYLLHKKDATVTGDIGCYTLGVAPPLNALHTCVDMGASICHAAGASHVVPADERKKTVAVIGDSTFIHSGITSLIDAVYNKADTTVFILDNSTTAMTGGQQHPATGRTIKNEQTHALDIEAMVRACGVTSVYKTDPYDLDASKAVIDKAMAEDGVSVVITNRPCCLEIRGQWGPAHVIDEEKCKNCGACLGLGCPAIIPQGEDRPPRIDPLLCTGCTICVQVCKFDAIAPEKK